MTLWDIFFVVYLIIGVVISTCAKIGHLVRFGYKLPWLHWWVGVFVWPFILLFGRKKQ